MIFATNNKGKLKEIRKILSEYEIYSLKDKNIDIDVIEDKDSFLENAIINKYRYWRFEPLEDLQAEALKAKIIELEGKHAVVVGRSAILGKPVSMLLLAKNATVTIAHSKTKNLEKLLKQADIVVACVGKPEFIQKEWLKEGVVIVDAGYNPGNVGDVAKDAYEIASAYTPVPGGVGPMTINMLLTQTVASFRKKMEK